MKPQPLTGRPATPATRPDAASEAGFLLLGVIVLVAIVLITLAVAAPVIAKDIRRQKEVESEHRAQQYVRAIRLYYRKLNSYPPSIDALKQSNNIRFLRQEYADPLTGKSDWRIIHLGEQKTTVKVFFGQDLGAVGASGGLGSGLGSAASLASAPAGGSSTSTIGATSALTAGFSGASVTTGTGPTGSSGSSGTLGSLGSFGSTGSTGGGGAIIGVGPAKTGSSILTPNKQTTYETWEFWYDPRIEQLYQKGRQNAGLGTGSLNSQSVSSFGASGATGASGAIGSSPGSNGPGSSGPGSFGSSTFGSSGSSSGAGSSTPPPPPAPTSPQ